MEHIGQTAISVEPTRTLSQSQRISTTTIPVEDHAALFGIINKSRLINGWTMRTAKELDPTIRVWFATFAAYNIPRGAYDELYKRAFDVRQSKLQQGDVNKVPALDATLLVSQWEGPNGLRAEMRQREIARGRTLTNNAASACELCFGSGFRTIKDVRGYVNSEKCDHKL